MLAVVAGVFVFQRVCFVEYALPHFVLVGGEAVAQGFVAGAEDAQREQGGVFRAIKGDGGDRHARRHLQDGEDAVPAVDGVAGVDGDADDRQRRDGGNHSRQVGGAASTGDDDAQAACGGGFAVVQEAFRGAVGGDDGDFVRNVELGAGLRGVAHDAQVAVAAHDDADFVHGVLCRVGLA